MFRCLDCRTYNYNILADINIRTYWGGLDNSILTDVDMITNVQRKECNAKIKKNWHWNSTSCFVEEKVNNTHPELNCFSGGRMTAFLPITQYRPVLTLAKSPRIIAPVWTITLPFRTIFCEPQMTVCRLTLFPDAFNVNNKFV